VQGAEPIDTIIAEQREGIVAMSWQVREVPPSVDGSSCHVAGLDVHYLRKGHGPVLVHLHDSLGNWGWLPLYERLAEDFDVIVPDLPGYGESQRPEWARHPRDLAIVVLQLLDRLGIERVLLSGIGLGGWLAAEMATMRQRSIERLVLVAPAGIKPRVGEIADQMLRGPLRFGLGGFRDAESFRQLFAIDRDEVDDVPDALYTMWDFSTEMTARIVWKPWMFSLELPHLLRGVAVPATVVWGACDELFPLDCGRQYVEVLADARLEVVAGAGHWIDLEAPEAVIAALSGGSA